MQNPSVGLSELRKNRISMPHARYFITCVAHNRCPKLLRVEIWQCLLKLIRSSDADIYAIVVMPDHLHLLIELPEGMMLGSIIRSIKGPMSPVIRAHGIKWQKNYFEHRLREIEETEVYLRYMLSNPYRAGLISTNEVWPYWAITSEKSKWFIDKFRNQRPEPEWIVESVPWGKSDGGTT